MGLVPAMQGTDAHVLGGGDILARCAIALCRLGWDERGTFNWSLVFKNISRCHLEAFQHRLFDGNGILQQS